MTGFFKNLRFDPNDVPGSTERLLLDIDHDIDAWGGPLWKILQPFDNLTAEFPEMQRRLLSISQGMHPRPDGQPWSDDQRAIAIYLLRTSRVPAHRDYLLRCVEENGLSKILGWALSAVAGMTLTEKEQERVRTAVRRRLESIHSDRGWISDPAQVKVATQLIARLEQVGEADDLALIFDLADSHRRMAGACFDAAFELVLKNVAHPATERFYAERSGAIVDFAVMCAKEQTDYWLIPQAISLLMARLGPEALRILEILPHVPARSWGIIDEMEWAMRRLLERDQLAWLARQQPIIDHLKVLFITGPDNVSIVFAE